MSEQNQQDNQQLAFNPEGIMHGPHKPVSHEEFSKINLDIGKAARSGNEADEPSLRDYDRRKAYIASDGIHRETYADMNFPQEVREAVQHDPEVVSLARENLDASRFQNKMNEAALNEARRENLITERNWKLGNAALGNQWEASQDAYTDTLAEVHEAALAHPADEAEKVAH